MRNSTLHLLIAFVAILATQSIYSNEPKIDNQAIQLSQHIASMPLSFTANIGQWDKAVSFRANVHGATMWFGPDGAYYQFRRSVKTEGVVDDAQIIPSTADKFEAFSSEDRVIETMMIKANFVGSNANPVIRGLEKSDYKCNYFIGNDKSKWAIDVPNYSAIVYENIYNGINLKYYNNGKQMEYDFIVEPGADFSQIKIRYDGAESISVNSDGQLVVTTKWGEVIEQRPVIYQNENNSRISVEGAYQIVDDKSFSFKLENYNQALPLVIDPVLSYSSYLGGGDYDYGFGIAVDNNGDVYVTGKTNSTDFPTLNSYESIIVDSSDVFITKVNRIGTSLIYSTYIGGSNQDVALDIAVDVDGAAYVTGYTFSTDFVTQNAFQGTLHSTDSSDAFVLKLNSSGNSLEYSTFLGGSENNVGQNIVVDASGAAYVAGSTSSNDFPTMNPLQATNHGKADVFVSKLNSTGDNLIYSTYLGGAENENAFGGLHYGGIAIDSTGAVYITGQTASSDFPTLNAFQESGTGSVFVTKLNQAGNGLIYSTYLGGSHGEFATGIALDETGAAYIAGSTRSTDFPLLNPFQSEYKGNMFDGFVTKLNPDGDGLVYSTYLGGSKSDIVRDIAVDNDGAAYIIGETNSHDFPILNPFIATHQNNYDVFITKLTPEGTSLLYSTYFGGSGPENGRSIAVDLAGYAYVTGNTGGSSDLPSLNPFQSEFQGYYDAFVVKINPVTSCCVVYRGNVDSDPLDQIDMADLIFLVDFMFLGGATPACLTEADVNGSGGASPVDISDIVVLVSSMFVGGSLPLVCP